MPPPDSALFAACYLYTSSPGLGLLLVVIVAATLGAFPFVFSREDGAVVATGAESFFAHMDELSGRLKRILIWTLVAFVVLPTVLGAFSVWCEDVGDLPTWWERFKKWGMAAWRWFFEGAGDIYGFLAAPLLDNLPESGSLIAIGSVSPAFISIKTAGFAAICVMMPFILSEAWKFVAPGLYDNEKGVALPLIATSAALFYAGMLFAHFVVFQALFKVMATIAPDTVNWTPDISEFFGFMLLMFFTFGLAFEVPVAVFILVRAGVVELKKIRKARRYVIVGAFVVAAIVTPPDILTQFLLAIPCWLLYEVGVLISAKWAVPKEESEEVSQTASLTEKSG